MYKATILITTYKRPHLLQWGLMSLSKQMLDKDKIQICVLNDGVEDDTEELCDSYRETLNIKYIFTGQRNKNREIWRVPGYAFNVGAKQTSSEFLFLSCAEIFHMGNTVDVMVDQLEKNKKSLVMCEGKDDDKSFLDKLEANGQYTDQDYNILPPLINVHLPFFMGMNRTDYMNIKGYNEAMTGVGFDDNDIVRRLQLVGNSHVKVNARIIHLFHERLAFNTREVDIRFQHNYSIFVNSGNDPVKNQGINWGNNGL